MSVEIRICDGQTIVNSKSGGFTLPPSADAVIYGVPDGAPANCHANASGDDAVRSIAGSTVE